MYESPDLAEDFAATGIPLAFLEAEDLEEFAAHHRTGRFAVLVLDQGSARLLERVGLSRSHQLQDLRGKVVIDLLQQLPLPVGSSLTQARLEVEAREEALREFGAFTSTEVSRLSGVTDKNPYARAQRWRREGRVFAVDFQGRLIYPAFQFDVDRGEPRPVLQEILAHAGSSLDGWQTAVWFTSPNGWLDDQRPVDLLDSEPESVVEASSHVAEESGY